MTGAAFSSALFAELFDTGEAGRLFSDSAEVRAMLIVEGALAKAQGGLGIIPEVSAAFIHRASLEVQIDPASLAGPTGQNGVSVPGLVAAFRKLMEAPEHAHYLHWGATSQDIIDTGLMLRLRQLLGRVEADLRTTVGALGTYADTHADTPVAARTWGQQASVTSLGAVAADWGAPLAELIEELPRLRAASLLVSLSGAAGTAAALGPDAATLRARLADALGLADPGRSWHADRGPLLRIADWLTRVALALGKMGEDLLLLTQTEIAELRLGETGGSSTMPQKQNPVGPSALVALARTTAGAQATLTGAALHRQHRDAAAWFTEWLSLPQVCLGAAAAAHRAKSMVPGLVVKADAMQAALDSNLGLIHAEALSFALAARMPRPEAQAETKALCRQAAETATSLATLAARAHPELDISTLFDPARQMGQAPRYARQFAKRAEKLAGQD